jgi:RHS repeat-associated protein
MKHGYDALSRRTSLTRPNGVNTSYSYDGLSHLLSVLHQAGNNVLDGASYAYDPAGNRLSKTNDLNGVTSNYSYDSIYELTQVTQGASTTETYSYDAVGNRLSSLGVTIYNYNVSNELTSNSNGSYTYDANGNTLSDPSGKSYSWDFENRLTQAVVPGTNGGTTTFKYDPFGRRIQKSGPLGTTNYLYDGRDLIEEIDASGSILAHYNDGVGFDQPLSMLRGGAVSFFQSDVLGSTTSLSGSSGALGNTYTYDGYGKLTASTGNVANPFRFTGREFDPETGIYYYRARYYDSTAGRFVSEDPIRFRGGIDFYAYTYNNPLNWIDPFGLEVQECRRPLSFDFSGDLPPHTFIYSTDTGTGWGLGPKNLWWAFSGAESGKPVPGEIELDFPYDPSGKLKPGYQCDKVSNDHCFEECVSEKYLEIAPEPPMYWLGHYQCDTFALDIERQCSQKCKNK